MLTEDLTAFMNVAEFATSCTLNGAPVSAIFDAAYALGSVGEFGIASAQPTLTLATADVPASPIGQAAVVQGVAYTVVSHEPDGTGVSRLLLRKV